MPPRASLGSVDRPVAGHHHRRRVGAVGRVGDEHDVRVAAAVLVVGAHQQQAGELAVGAGRGLQRGAGQAGDLGQPAAERVHELERALDQLLGLVGVQPAQARQRGDALVDLGVVLHGARAQRIGARLDAVVAAPTAR